MKRAYIKGSFGKKEGSAYVRMEESWIGARVQ